MSIMKDQLFFFIFIVILQDYCTVTRPTTSIKSYDSNNVIKIKNNVADIRTRSESESSEEDDDEENTEDFTLQIVEFFKLAVEQIKSDPNIEKKITKAIEKLISEFTESEYSKSFITLLLRLAMSFIEGKFFAPPKIIAELIAKANRDMKRQPDPLGYNVSKVGYKTLRTVGNGMENVGDLLSDTIRIVKDLHKTQAGATNYLSKRIPVVGGMVRMYNSAMNGGLEALELTTRYSLGSGGKALSKSANKRQESLKERKRKKKKEESDSSSDDEDSDESLQQSKNKNRKKKNKNNGSSEEESDESLKQSKNKNRKKKNKNKEDTSEEESDESLKQLKNKNRKKKNKKNKENNSDEKSDESLKQQKNKNRKKKNNKESNEEKSEELSKQKNNKRKKIRNKDSSEEESEELFKQKRNRNKQNSTKKSKKDKVKNSSSSEEISDEKKK